jgi:hypothetical protein
VKTAWRVWFHRSRAILWVIAAILVFPLGWQDSVVVVIMASFYANFTGDWGAAEAADDRELTARLDRIENKIDELGEGSRRADAG